MKDFKGTTIKNKYDIKEQLGKGGMGSVYLARDIDLGAFRAVKIIDKEGKYQTDKLVEVEIMKNTQHPYLPTVIEVEDDGRYVYVIMELITGTTLDNVIKNNPNISEVQVVKWAKQLCDILSYLHNKLDYKIIYKDLKPSNIMVSPDGERITLIDFGVSQIISRDRLENNIPIGTKGYAAPEQFKTAPIDERADIYALGVTLYHILTGKSPRMLEDGFIPLREQNLELSEGIEYIVAKCIQEDKELRYSNIDDMILDLENINKIGRAYEEKIKAKKRKVAIYGVGASLSAMLALGGWGNINSFIDGKYNEFIQQGILYRDGFKFDEAIESFEKAQSYMSRENTAYYEVAKTYMSKGSVDESILYLNKAIEKSSSRKRDENFNYLIGKAYFLKGRYDMALTHFKKVKSDKDVDGDFKHLNNISKELENLTTTGNINVKELKEALNGFELYIDSNNKDKFVASNLYVALANVYSNIPYEKINNTTDMQIKILEKAMNVNSGDYTVIERLATAYRQKSRDIQLTNKELRDEYINKSLQTFDICLSLQPSIDVYRNIGDLYLEIGNFEQAEVNYKTMINLNKEHYSGYVKMAALRYAQQNIEDTRHYLDEAEGCKVYPDNDPQYNNLRKTLG